MAAMTSKADTSTPKIRMCLMEKVLLSVSATSRHYIERAGTRLVWCNRLMMTIVKWANTCGLGYQSGISLATSLLPSTGLVLAETKEANEVRPAPRQFFCNDECAEFPMGGRLYGLRPVCRSDQFLQEPSISPGRKSRRPAEALEIVFLANHQLRIADARAEGRRQPQLSTHLRRRVNL